MKITKEQFIKWARQNADSFYLIREDYINMSVELPEEIVFE